MPKSGFHRVNLINGDWSEDKDRDPRPEVGDNSSEDILRGEYSTDKANDERGGGDGEADGDGGFHRFGVSANENGQADEEHNEVHNGVGYSEMFLAVKVSEIFELGSL